MKTRSWIFAILVVAIVAPAILSRAHAQNRRTPPRETTNTARQREKWFYAQREYPLGYIPAGARLKALQQVGKMQRQLRDLRSQAALATGFSFPSASLANSIALSLANWTLIGPKPSVWYGDMFSGRVTALAFDPNDSTDKTIYLCAAEGGVWKTTDGGRAWTPLTDFQPSLAVGSIALDPTTNPTTIYIGTGEADFSIDSYYGAGILKSTDGGKTWTRDSTFNRPSDETVYASGPSIGALAVDPSNDQVVLAGVSQAYPPSTVGAGIWRSTDAGTTWTRVLPQSSYGAATAVVFDPHTPGLAYAALGDPYGGNSTNGVYKSTDDGATWSVLPISTFGYSASGRIALAIGPPASSGKPGELLMAASDGIKGTLLGLWLTTDGGATWNLLSGTPDFCKGQCWYDMAIAIDPANPSVFYAGGTQNSGGSSLTVSLDSGATWSPDLSDGNFTGGGTPAATGYLHTDTHAIVFSKDAAALAVGNDGGMWTTTNVAANTNVTWSNANSGLAITQFYPGIAIALGDLNLGLGGTQDNGTQMFSGSTQWTEVPTCGDGGYTAFTPSGTTSYAICAAGEGLWVNNGTGWNWAGNGIGTCTTDFTSPCYSTPWVPPFAMDPEKPSVLYFGAQAATGSAYVLYQSTDAASSWQPISPDFSGSNYDTLSTIAVAPSSSDVVYVATFGGKIWMTTDAGAGTSSSWQEIDAGLPLRSITDVAVDPVSPTTAYVSFSGFATCSTCDGKGHIYESNDGGTTWTDISGNLPDTPVDYLTIDPALANTIYAATDVGVFVTTDAGVTWTPMLQGLPNVAILGLTLDEPTRTLWAGTHGRSVWAAQLPLPPEPAASPVSVSFSSQTVNTTSSPHPITLSNSGGETLAISAISVISGFAETNNCGASLAPNSNCVINVTFTPSATGSITGALTISNNLRSSPLTVSLSGTGSAASPISASPALLIFGSQSVNTNSSAQSVALSNSGSASLTSLSFSISGDFSVTESCGTALSAGANCPLSVNFLPKSAGSLTGTLTISGTLGSSSIHLTVSLYGYATSSFILPTAGLRFVPITPCRVVDTRSGDGPFGGPTIAGGTSRDFVIPSSSCGIPSTAEAYSLNVAVVPAGSLGYLTVWPTGQQMPLVATLNSVDGRVKSNAAIVPAGTGGAISVFASNPTDVVIDINGYFDPPTDLTALQFYPVTPCRLVDTRNPDGPLAGPLLVGGQSRTFPIQSSSCNIPATAQAYSLNFAAVPKGPLGYLTAWPTGQPQPYVATLNAVTGTVTANAAIVPAGSSGDIDVYASNDTDLVIDINGYFAPPNTGGLSLYVLPPCRVLDTRQPAGSQPFSGTINVNVTSSSCGVSASAQAFVFNATVVPPGALGYLTMWPQGTTQPYVATLNAIDAAVTNNMAIVPTANGSISAFASNPTQLVLDIFAFFGP